MIITKQPIVSTRGRVNLSIQTGIKATKVLGFVMGQKFASRLVRNFVNGGECRAHWLRTY